MSQVWDKTTPVGTEAIANGDDRIREMKTAIEAALQGQTTEGLEAVFPGTSASTAPIFRYRGLKGNTGARPAAGQGGLYINTTLNALQRDNGSSWDDVATLIPSGTKMPFYQASPPVGWTAVSVNDKFMRVVVSGGSGGSTGGSGNTPGSGTSLAHSHTVNSHTHDLGNHTHVAPAHAHIVPRDGWGTGDNSTAGGKIATGGGLGAGQYATNDMTTSTAGGNATGVPSSNTSGATAPGTDSQLSTLAFQYADFIVASKD